MLKKDKNTFFCSREEFKKFFDSGKFEDLPYELKKHLTEKITYTNNLLIMIVKLLEESFLCFCTLEKLKIHEEIKMQIEHGINNNLVVGNTDNGSIEDYLKAYLIEIDELLDFECDLMNI